MRRVTRLSRASELWDSDVRNSLAAVVHVNGVAPWECLDHAGHCVPWRSHSMCNDESK